MTTTLVTDIRNQLTQHMAALPGIQYSFGYQKLTLPEPPQSDLVYTGFKNEPYLDGGAHGKRRVTHTFTAQVTLMYTGDNSQAEDQLLAMVQMALDYFDQRVRQQWPNGVIEARLTDGQAKFVQQLPNTGVFYRVLECNFTFFCEELTAYQVLT